ncbi:MAG: TolC family protein [bacterium]
MRWPGRVVLLGLCVLCLVAVPAAGAEHQPGYPLSLAEAIGIVLRESPQTEIAAQGAASAEEQRKSVRGEFLPKLRTEFEITGFNDVPTVEIPAMPPLPARTFDAGSDHEILSRTSLEQPLFTGLALVSRYRLADLSLSQAEVQREATRQDLILRTHEAYFDVLVSEKLLRVAEQSVTQLESHAEVARQFFETGMIPKNDLLKAQVQLADVKQNRIIAAHRLDVARTQFNILLRRKEDEPVLLSEELRYRPYEGTLEDSVQVALSRQPELLISELDIRKAEQSVRLARSALYPHFGLVGALTHDEGGFATSDKVLSGTLHGDWAVWDWGTNYYNVKSAESQRSVAEARHRQLADLTRLQVRQAYLALEEWREAIGVAEASIDQAKENFRITEDQFKANVTTNTEVLDAQTLLSRAQVNYYSALNRYNISVARLQKAMGVLTQPDE